MTNQLDYSRVDWSTFWTKERVGEDWLVEPFLARGRGHSLNAQGGQGKSLLFQECAFALASGRPVLYRKESEPISVLYVDMEMTEDDLHERVCDFGYSQADDLSNLHYLLLPDLPALDTSAGGKVLLEAARDYKAEVVFIDTLARVIEGEEDKADTIRRFYRHTGLKLKAMGVTWARADHVGKNVDLGGRGSSAKNDDVDVVWQLAVRGQSVTLIAKKQRMRWVPGKVSFHRQEEPWTSHVAPERAMTAGIVEIVAKLATLQVPIGTGRPTARRLLNDAGITVGNDVLAAALRWRREHGV